MKKNIVMYGAAFALVLSMCAAVFGQAPANQKSANVKRAAMFVHLVELQITAPDGQTSKVMVKEGGMAKFGCHGPKCNYTFGFVPVVRGDNGAHADVTVLRLTRNKDGKESMRRVERFPMATGESKTTTANPRLTLKLLAIKNLQSSSL